MVKEHEAHTQREAEPRDGQRILAGREALVMAVAKVLLQVCPSHKWTGHPFLHIQDISLWLDLARVTFLSLAANRSKMKSKPQPRTHVLRKLLPGAPDTAGIFPGVFPPHLVHANQTPKKDAVML